MTNILKKLSGWFGGDQTAHSNSSLPVSRNPQHSMLHDGSVTATRGQLVQVLLRDLLRKSGMPPGWVQCQIQVMNSRSRGKGIFVRLVVKHWDERLMKYAFAFQKALLTDIVQIEPKAASWLQGIAWQLEVASSCPLTELPGPEFWQPQMALAAATQPIDPFDIIPMPANAVAVTAAAPKRPIVAESSVAAAITATPFLNVPEAPDSPSEVIAPLPDDTAQDLERLFAIRDNELANMSANNLLPAGYETTEPAPLQIR
jgi:hypothetical protein